MYHPADVQKIEATRQQDHHENELGMNIDLPVNIYHQMKNNSQDIRFQKYQFHQILRTCIDKYWRIAEAILNIKFYIFLGIPLQQIVAMK